jgi:hypothetical protein
MIPPELQAILDKHEAERDSRDMTLDEAAQTVDEALRLVRTIQWRFAYAGLAHLPERERQWRLGRIDMAARMACDATHLLKLEIDMARNR